MDESVSHDKILYDFAAKMKGQVPQSTVKTHFLFPQGEADFMQYWADNEKFKALYFAIGEIKCHDSVMGRYKAQGQLDKFACYLNKIFKHGGTSIDITPYYVCGVDDLHYAVHNWKSGLYELVEAEFQIRR